MAIKIVDELKAMGNFPIAHADGINLVKEDGSEDNLQNLFNNGALSGGGGASYITLSQEEYDVLSDEEKVNGSEYRTYDTGHIYKLGIEYGKDGVQISDNETVEDKTWSSKKTSDEIAKVDASLGELEEKIGNIDNLKLINLGENADADNCRIADRDINGVYGYCGFFTQNVPMEGYAEIRCYHYGGGIRQFIDYTARTNTKTYTRFIQYNGILPTAWQELATMDKVVPSDNYSTITKSIKLTRRTKTYIFKDVNTSETKRYFELNVNGNVSHSGDVFFRKYVGLLYLYPWTGASRGLYLEQVQHIGMTVDSTQIDIAYGWDENGVYIQNNGALNLPIDIVAPSSWFVN